MTEWEPATDAEVAMRDALRTDDQESYFRILASVDLLLPVSADALAGLAPLGWGTWSTGGRTHVLAFTSPSALQACLADYTGSARRVAYTELADTWPNLEWWLAVNPGLPIEGYLPAWFVAQLSRGDLRLPTRGPARDPGPTSQNPQDLQAAAMAANAARAVGGPQGGPVGQGIAGPRGGAAAAATGSRGPIGDEPPPAYGQAEPPGLAARSTAAPASGGPGPGTSQFGPGGLPIRTPGAVLPSGLPSRRAANPTSAAPSAPTSASPVRGSAPGWPGSDAPSGFGQARDEAEDASAAHGPSAGPAPQQPAYGPLPVRTPLAQTPPLPNHLAPPGGNVEAPPTGTEGLPQRSSPEGTPQRFEAMPRFGGAGPSEMSPDRGDALPRRTAVPPSDLPSSMAAQALAGSRTPQPTTAPRPSTAPPSGPPAGPGQPTPLGQAAPGPVAPPGQKPGQSPSSGQQIGQPSSGQQTGQWPSSSGQSPSGPPVIPGVAGAARGTAVPADPAETGRSTSPAALRPTTPSGRLAPGQPAQGEPTPGQSTPGQSTPGRQTPPTDTGADREDFTPANAVERDLLEAADEGSTDRFLSTLLLATILVPVAHTSRPGSAPGESGFAFRTEEIDGERFLVVFTSRDRLAEHFAEPTRTVGVRFYELIRNWPDPAWSFAVNPGSPVGAKYPGPQVIALANWAADAGLGADGPEADERDAAPVPAPQKASDATQHATVMQKTVPPEQVDYYLERGYDRVAGFVHRANEVDHLRSPAELFAALGLGYDGSPFQPDAKEAHVLRWPAYRPSLYRIPYGGQSEQALRAMDGWVIERPPFRGNGFAPGEGRDVIAEFKVDSVRLPHGAQLWRMDADGTEKMVAIFDADAPTWRRVGEQ